MPVLELEQRKFTQELNKIPAAQHHGIGVLAPFNMLLDFAISTQKIAVIRLLSKKVRLVEELVFTRFLSINQNGEVE